MAKQGKIIELGRGDYVRVLPTPAFVMESAQTAIPYPDPPIYTDPDTGEKIPNPDHPVYVRQVTEVEQQRNRASIDAMLAFSLVLVDEKGERIEPPDDGWDKKLALFGIGVPDDKDERELVYIREIAVTPEDLEKLMKEVGISDLERAQATFQSNQVGSADN